MLALVTIKGADRKRSAGVGSRFTWVWSVTLGGEWLSLVIFGSIVGRCMGWVVFSLSYHANAASDFVLVWGLMNPGSERWWVACALCNALVRRVFNALASHPWSCSQGSPGGSGVSVCARGSCVYMSKNLDYIYVKKRFEMGGWAPNAFSRAHIGRPQFEYPMAPI